MWSRSLANKTGPGVGGISNSLNRNFGANLNMEPIGQNAKSTNNNADLYSKSTLQRVHEELSDLQRAPLSNCHVEPTPGDIYHWTIKIHGPQDSPYEDGIFNVDLKFPPDYPAAPPRVVMLTPIYHCNIDERGLISLDLLRGDWSSESNASIAIQSVISLLVICNPDEPLVPEISELKK